MQELFRDIDGYEGLYQISNLGNVKSFKAVSKGRNLKHVYRKGYATVALRKNGVSKIHSIHRLVATAFIPNPDNLPVINHKDGDRCNNDISNLEWCTQLENMRHAFRSGLIKHKPLTDEQKAYISKRTKEGMNNPITREKISKSRRKYKEVV